MEGAINSYSRPALEPLDCFTSHLWRILRAYTFLQIQLKVFWQTAVQSVRVPVYKRLAECILQNTDKQQWHISLPTFEAITGLKKSISFSSGLLL